LSNTNEDQFKGIEKCRRETDDQIKNEWRQWGKCQNCQQGGGGHYNINMQLQKYWLVIILDETFLKLCKIRLLCWWKMMEGK
jgi:hypothetical protein